MNKKPNEQVIIDGKIYKRNNLFFQKDIDGRMRLYTYDDYSISLIKVCDTQEYISLCIQILTVPAMEK